METPYVPMGLARFLDEVYVPRRHPNTAMSDRDIWIAVGRRELVDELVAIADAQIERGSLEGASSLQSPQALSNVFHEDAQAGNPGSGPAASRSAGFGPGNRI
jgi:hypothetical protein